MHVAPRLPAAVAFGAVCGESDPCHAFASTDSGLPAHVGLSGFVLFFRLLSSHVSGDSPSFGMLAIGVGHCFTAACKSPPPLAVRPSSFFRSADSAPPVIVRGVGHCFALAGSVGLPPLWTPSCLESAMFGVGHCRIASVSVVPGLPLPLPPFDPSRVAVAFLAPLESDATAVGQDEQPRPLVGGSHFGRTEHSPFRIEPIGREVLQNLAQSEGDVSSDVFEECHRGICIPDDPSHVRPQVSRVVCAESLSCVAERLARIAASDDMNSATPRSAVEGGGIAPHRARIHPTRLHLLDQVRNAKCFPLHHAHRSSTWHCQL